jgi:hypothetical protein
MPYIESSRRSRLYPEGIGESAVGPGELNYLLTVIINEYLPMDPKYHHYNEVIGVLESCKLEFYRRAVAQYEDKKIKENGDMYV